MQRQKTESGSCTEQVRGNDVLEYTVAERLLDPYILNEKSTNIDTLMPGSPEWMMEWKYYEITMWLLDLMDFFFFKREWLVTEMEK